VFLWGGNNDAKRCFLLSVFRFLIALLLGLTYAS
jgi:hypothetical protein